MRKPAKPPPKLASRGGILEVLEQVGEGASATVYWCRDVATEREVALKVGKSEAMRRHLADEAELLAGVDCPTLARLRDAGTIPSSLPAIGAGLPYVAFEWTPGAAVRPSMIARALRVQTALAVARDVGAALAELHALGVAHGDVKPANILVDGVGAETRAVLIDLGLGSDADALEPTGGTRRYLPPECFGAESAGDGRARDLWAFGVTLAEIASAEVAAAGNPAVAANAAALPSEIAGLVGALLARVPAARPHADWVVRVARAETGQAETEPDRIARRRRLVRRAYLAVRRPELVRATRGRALEIRVTGTAGEFMQEALASFERVAALRSAATSEAGAALVDLDALGRARFLTNLVGGAAARWPLPDVPGDSALIDCLLDRAAHKEPLAFSVADVIGGGVSAPRSAPSEPVGLALALSGPAPSAADLERAEELVRSDPAARPLTVVLGRALRLRGELGRALAVLVRDEGPEAQVEAAECLRRAGDPEGAEARLDAAAARGNPGDPGARALAIRARIRLDGGDPASALALLDGAPTSVAILEVRALAEVLLGGLERARTAIDQARILAERDEERARIEAVLGNLAHAAGESVRALEAFRRAADHAGRAGALLEEAVYSTGIAAAGFDAGELGEALDAAARATLLFEHLGKPQEAARALLARAATFAAAGAATLAREAAEEAIFRAREARDGRCRGFAHLVLADVLPAEDPDGLEHARRAGTLLKDGPNDDRLRADARRLDRGDDVDTARLDALAEDGSTAVPARLDWWGARATSLARSESPVRPDRVLSALSALASMPGPMSGRGEAFAAGAALAARTGDAETARRFALVAIESARKLSEGAPPSLRQAVLSLEWARAIRRPTQEPGILPEQIADVESLVRALGTRDRLRPLLDQVLDALVLWTGVERGLLLLRAGDRLVPRAARNIARRDLVGAQLSLSRSLAERALATGEPVVAVDAAGELPEVHESVHALKLRSVLAVPLLARGEALGVVYLDDRVRRGAFGPGELAWVRLVATLAAVAIADARDQLSLRRAARRARRAEARLSESLARREAELDVAHRELAVVRGARGTRFPYDEFVGDSPAIRSLLALVDRITPSEVPVLVTGESGSGKELVARAIHKNGPRGAGPFVSENCAAIPEGLLESTLFGHVRGAFTGANRPHAGLFEVASGGTLFLDEIGEMSLGMQTKLLRVLEDGEVRPVGSERARRVDVRVVAATHRDLDKMVAAGTFRGDLFYRLNVIHVAVPSLRDRPSDVEALARHLVKKYAGERPVRISRAVLDALSSYTWPGNVRQLENELRRALVLADDVIRPEHLSSDVKDGGAAEATRPDGLNVRRRVDSLEAELVRAALERTAGNQTRAAELLGLSRFGLQKMIRRLGIAMPSSLALQDGPGAVTGDR